MKRSRHSLRFSRKQKPASRYKERPRSPGPLWGCCTSVGLCVWGRPPAACCSSPVSAAERNAHEALVTSDYITKTARLGLGHQLIVGADTMPSTTPQKWASYPLRCARHHARCWTQSTSVRPHSAGTRERCFSHAADRGLGSTERGRTRQGQTARSVNWGSKPGSLALTSTLPTTRELYFYRH